MECPFRLAQEVSRFSQAEFLVLASSSILFHIILLQGLKSIASFLGPKRRVQVTRDDFILLLTNDDPRFPPEITKFSEPVQERLKSMGKTFSDNPRYEKFTRIFLNTSLPTVKT